MPAANRNSEVNSTNTQMMRITFPAILVFLAATHLSLAQNIVELQDKPLAVPGANISAIEVIDARPDTTLIGVQETGMANQKKQVHVLKGGTAGITGFLKRNLPMKAGGDSIIIKINRLAIDEKLDYSHGKRIIASLKADLSAYLKKGGNFYLLLRKEYNASEKGLGIGNKHANNIAEMFKQCLTEVTSSTQKAATSQPSMKEEVWAKEIPEVMKSAPAKGLYMSFEEFRNNRPSHPEATVELSSDEKQPFYISYKNNGAMVKLGADDYAWAFCDGQNVYFKQQGYYFNLDINEKSVTFTGFDYYAILRRKMVGPLLASAVTVGVLNGLRLNAKATSAFCASNVRLISNEAIMQVAIDISKAKTSKDAAENIHDYKIYMDNGDFIQSDLSNGPNNP